MSGTPVHPSILPFSTLIFFSVLRLCDERSPHTIQHSCGFAGMGLEVVDGRVRGPKTNSIRSKQGYNVTDVGPSIVIGNAIEDSQDMNVGSFSEDSS